MHIPSLQRLATRLFPLVYLSLTPVVGCHHTGTPPLAAEASSKKQPCPTCVALKEQWPSIVEDVEAAAATPDRTLAGQRAQAVTERLQAVESSACPLWRRRAKQEQAQLLDLMEMHDTLHAADGTVAASETLSARFWRLHTPACLAASKASAGSFEVWSAGQGRPVPERRQRYVANLANDAAAVNVHGAVGAKAQEDTWTGLVQTSTLVPLAGQLSVLQGQGPLHDEVARAYVEGAVRYAADHKLPQVLFVNAAGGQVPHFGTTVAAQAAASSAEGLDLQFMELTDWADGALVSPQRAAQLAVGIADRLTLRQGPSLLVLNCNAGLDRSGTLNTLVQLVALTQKRLHEGAPTAVALKEAQDSLDTVVGNIKAARGHAISSASRYAFLHAALLAYGQSLTPA